MNLKKYFDTCPLYTVRVIWKNAYMSCPTVSAVFSLGQPSLGGWFCGSAALSGDSRDRSGASSHSVGPALSLCNTRATTQVDIRAQLSIKTIPRCQQTEMCVSVCLYATGQLAYPFLSLVGGASCHLMHFEAHHSEGFSSSCFVVRQAQVNTWAQLQNKKLRILFPAPKPNMN